MHRLDQTIQALVDNEQICDLRPNHPKDACETVLSIQSATNHPYLRLDFSLIRGSIITNTAANFTYNLGAGQIPTTEDLLNAHLKVETKRKYGPVCKIAFELTDSKKIMASAQFTADNVESESPKLTYANAHVKTGLITKIGGDPVIVTGKKNLDDYHHVSKIFAGSLRTNPYILTDPVDCAKFMHAAYSALKLSQK